MLKKEERLLFRLFSIFNHLNYYPRLEISGILFTMTNPRTLHCKEVIDVTKRAFGNRIRVFDTLVPTTVRFKEAPAAGESILSYDSASAGAEAYRELTKEVMNEKS